MKHAIEYGHNTLFIPNEVHPTEEAACSQARGWVKSVQEKEPGATFHKEGPSTWVARYANKACLAVASVVRLDPTQHAHLTVVSPA